MKRSLLLLALSWLACSPAWGQGRLYFTTRRSNPPETALAGCGGQLDLLGPKNVEMVAPAPGGGYSAGKFLPAKGMATLLGDFDGNGVYDTTGLSPIDAVVICGAGPRPNVRDMFLSVALPVTGVCGAGWTMRPGDVFRIPISGIPEVMLSEEQIIAALQLLPGDVVNVDAFEVSSTDGTIYLSFENTVHLFGTDVLQDGGVAAIPGSDVVWTGCKVTAVNPGSGVIAISEPAANSYVTNANIADHAGIQVLVIQDLDGLTEDPQGGQFTVQYRGETYNFDNLLFTGRALTGGGICTTNAGGQIAFFNGVPMGAAPPAVTTGVQVGLNPGPPLVGTLNALEHTGLAARFVMDSPDTQLVVGDNLILEVGGVPPGGFIMMFYCVGPMAPCGIPIFFPLPNPCFPEWAVNGPLLYSMGFGPAGAVGCKVNNYGPYGGGVPAGLTLMFQGASVRPSGVVGLSTPLLLQFQ